MKKLSKVPSPFNKWIGKRGWSKMSKSDRKLLTDLNTFQRSMRKHFKNKSSEEYVNMNAEIEYERMNGLR